MQSAQLLRIKLVSLAAVAGYLLAGCGCGQDQSGNGSLKGSEQTSLAAMHRAANEYKGDWKLVPEEDKELILTRFDGDEDAAKSTIESMAAQPAMKSDSQFNPNVPTKATVKSAKEANAQGGQVGINEQPGGMAPSAAPAAPGGGPTGAPGWSPSR